ncbi:YtnP family quorum-quenching lactonase [Listeria kieliensis]|uniref:Metallo-beta-lactamase domain-containing protein n=1 Tax=Listeria kieliensis TaxID=1621700 RepID=A0A3D8TUV5_9LIST|nr:MBL fold metallo-hydrolase [Listeria kieliensis]RDX02788.1 hypothetical protein UR08_04585 [Listeria kieliensis]
MQLGEIKIDWLRGGELHLDGGTMFGVVPKALWSKKYPVNEKNLVPTRTDPIFVQFQGKNILIDAGIGNNRLTEKQWRNFGVAEESNVHADLCAKKLTEEDIDIILMTHLHYDHVLGLTGKRETGQYYSVFPNAQIFVEQTEWNEMREPNVRSKATYWKENWESIADQVVTYQGEIEPISGIKMIHTGGHSAGHAVIEFSSNGKKAIHMADIFPTHAHQNILWVTAFDDYPMDSIFQKQALFEKWMDGNSWFLFYHDAKYRAIKLSPAGELVDSILI